MIYAGIIVGSWLLTLITYILGYQAGKASGFSQAYAGSKAIEPLENGENGMKTS